MPELERVGTLEVHQDLDFQRREWVAQRIGWVAILVFVLAAVAGVFGSGPASRARAGDSDLSVEYERFARRSAPVTLHIHLRDAAGRPRLEISRDYLRAFRVERVTPEPVSLESSATALIYTFASAAPETEITFHLHAESAGPQRAVVRGAGRELVFRQFIYP